MTDRHGTAPTVTTVVPVKPARGAKSRLSSVLDGDARADLARTLLVRTVEVAREVGPVLVVSASAGMRALAATHGAVGLVEDDTGLDAAVAQGLARATADGADTALVLPVDLPRVTVADVLDLLAVAPNGPGVVVVPCQRDDGTNAMVLRPPEAITPQYGPDSAARHLQAARRAGLAAVLHRSTGFVDLDVPEDWHRHARPVAGQNQAIPPSIDNGTADT